MTTAAGSYHPFSDEYPVDHSTVSLVWRNLSVKAGHKVLLH